MINDKTEHQKIMLIKEFKTQLVTFLDELIDQFPNEGDLILIRIFIKDQIPMADVLGRYQRDILPYEHKVKNRDEKFFLEHELLYAKTPIGSEKVNHFKELWTKNIIDKNDKDTVWRWMDVFNLIARKYVNHFGYIPGWEPKQETMTPQLNNVIYNNDSSSLYCENNVCKLR